MLIALQGRPYVVVQCAASHPEGGAHYQLELSPDTAAAAAAAGAAANSSGANGSGNAGGSSGKAEAQSAEGQILGQGQGQGQHDSGGARSRLAAGGQGVVHASASVSAAVLGDEGHKGSAYLEVVRQVRARLRLCV